MGGPRELCRTWRFGGLTQFWGDPGVWGGPTAGVPLLAVSPLLGRPMGLGCPSSGCARFCCPRFWGVPILGCPRPAVSPLVLVQQVLVGHQHLQLLQVLQEGLGQVPIWLGCLRRWGQGNTGVTRGLGDTGDTMEVSQSQRHRGCWGHLGVMETLVVTRAPNEGHTQGHQNTKTRLGGP